MGRIEGQHGDTGVEHHVDAEVIGIGTRRRRNATEAAHEHAGSAPGKLHQRNGIVMLERRGTVARGVGLGNPELHQVDVILRLRNRVTGRTYQADEKADLRQDEASWVAAEIPAPQGEYSPEVEAQYPP